MQSHQGMSDERKDSEPDNRQFSLEMCFKACGLADFGSDVDAWSDSVYEDSDDSDYEDA